MTTNLNRKKSRIPIIPSVDVVERKLAEVKRDVEKLEVLLRVAKELEAIDKKNDDELL